MKKRDFTFPWAIATSTSGNESWRNSITSSSPEDGCGTHIKRQNHKITLDILIVKNMQTDFQVFFSFLDGEVFSFYLSLYLCPAIWAVSCDLIHSYLIIVMYCTASPKRKWHISWTYRKWSVRDVTFDTRQNIENLATTVQLILNCWYYPLFLVCWKMSSYGNSLRRWCWN